MNIIARIIGTTAGVIIYPLVWLLKWFVVFAVELFNALDKVAGAALKELNKLMDD